MPPLYLFAVPFRAVLPIYLLKDKHIFVVQKVYYVKLRSIGAAHFISIIPVRVFYLLMISTIFINCLLRLHDYYKIIPEIQSGRTDITSLCFSLYII